MSTGTVEQDRTDRIGRLTRDVSVDELVASLARRDQHAWAAHVASAAGCAHPIRLSGTLTRVEQTTGRITSEAHTTSMPDGVLYTACGNRRATVSPSCAETYRADTFLRARLEHDHGAKLRISYTKVAEFQARRAARPS